MLCDKSPHTLRTMADSAQWDYIDQRWQGFEANTREALREALLELQPPNNANHPAPSQADQLLDKLKICTYRPNMAKAVFAVLQSGTQVLDARGQPLSQPDQTKYLQDILSRTGIGNVFATSTAVLR